MGSGSAWTEEEDDTLALCWLLISIDSITGRGQTKGKFWERIFESFVSKMKEIAGDDEPNERSSTACQNRWSLINRDVNKFVGIMHQLRNPPCSGYSAEQYLEEALKLFH
jgi:hypothetical protein